MKKEANNYRENNYYKKSIVDPESGEITRDVKKSLDEHKGFGSAKKKKEN